MSSGFLLQWRHNERDGVSNQEPHDCLLNRLFRRRSKKTSKLRITGPCEGIYRWPVNSPHAGPVTREMFPFDDITMPISYNPLLPLTLLLYDKTYIPYFGWVTITKINSEEWIGFHWTEHSRVYIFVNPSFYGIPASALVLGTIPARLLMMYNITRRSIWNWLKIDWPSEL